MKYSFFLLFILLMHSTNAQDLSKHQWNDRILLVLSEDFENGKIPLEYFNQIKELNKNHDGLKDRKTVVYSVLPTEYQFINPINHKETDWIKSDSLFVSFNQEKEPFKVILIGLDGTIKLTRTDFFSSKELFAIIDGMPMRKAEMKSRN